MSFGMFCAIPLPFRAWDDSLKNLMLPCFPLVGVVIGVLWWTIAEILLICGLHTVLTAAIVTIMPFLLTGLLHLDGYMDTNDAILSRRPLEEKLRILKDPHMGAFSAIALVILAIAQFGAVYAIIDGNKDLFGLLCIAVISRCCSAASILRLNAMPQSSYANMFKQNAQNAHTGFVIATAAIITTIACLFTGYRGLIVTACTILGFSCALAYAYREFKGISGDLTGYSLVIGELCGLLALAVL
jgi:adenosylcobinamide-GDP ribazoletransferase